MSLVVHLQQWHVARLLHYEGGSESISSLMPIVNVMKTVCETASLIRCWKLWKDD